MKANADRNIVLGAWPMASAPGGNAVHCSGTCAVAGLALPLAEGLWQYMPVLILANVWFSVLDFFILLSRLILILTAINSWLLYNG